MGNIMMRTIIAAAITLAVTSAIPPFQVAAFLKEIDKLGIKLAIVHGPQP